MAWVRAAIPSSLAAEHHLTCMDMHVDFCFQGSISCLFCGKEFCSVLPLQACLKEENLDTYSAFPNLDFTLNFKSSCYRLTCGCHKQCACDKNHMAAAQGLTLGHQQPHEFRVIQYQAEYLYIQVILAKYSGKPWSISPPPPPLPLAAGKVIFLDEPWTISKVNRTTCALLPRPRTDITRSPGLKKW